MNDHIMLVDSLTYTKPMKLEMTEHLSPQYKVVLTQWTLLYPYPLQSTPVHDLHIPDECLCVIDYTILMLNSRMY